MPFECYKGHRGFYTRLWGEVTIQDFEAKNMHFTSDPRCDKYRYQIIDGTDIRSLNLSDYDFAKIASSDIGMSCYMRDFSMVLVNANPFIQSRFKSYITICLEANITWKFLICNTLFQAKEWLKMIDEESGLKNPAPPRLGNRPLNTNRWSLSENLSQANRAW